nr:hypothetical protein [Dyadobacter jiangsuensis]
MDRYVLSSALGDPVHVTNWCHTHIPSLLSGPPHAMKSVQSPAVILYFGRSQVKGQHHFIFGDRKIKRLFDRLRLHTHFSQDADHLIGVARIPAKTVPFRKKHQVGFTFRLFQFRY